MAALVESMLHGTLFMGVFVAIGCVLGGPSYHRSTRPIDRRAPGASSRIRDHS